MLKQLVKKITPRFLVSAYHFIWAFLSALVYGFPSRKIKVIGITGTHGKTTVVSLAVKILEEAGYKVAAVSSLKFYIAGKEQENKLKMTMPGRGFLQGFLRKAVKAGCQYAVLEATSEGVLQHRHRFISFDTMVFTNLYREHIERHGGFENYKKAKGEYFKKCKGSHIINVDDKNVDYFLNFSVNKRFLFSIKTPNSPSILNSLLLHSSRPMTQEVIKAEQIEEQIGKISFIIDNSKFIIHLPGEFNIYNSLAAIAVGQSQRISLEVCQKGLAKVKGVPGRMEEVISQPFKVVVDYAFTPDALEQVYRTLQDSGFKIQDSRLVCVLGACGGGRDKWKRPELGKVAGRYCREVIITNEDPYDENPMEIINQVVQGAEKIREDSFSNSPKFVYKILDRREAIRKALTLVQPGDTVVITGKGAENSIAVKNNKKIPWDDRQVVRQEFKKLQQFH